MRIKVRDLKKKIETFRKDGPNSIQVITDFDMTLTKAFNEDGSIASNSISVLRNENYLSKEYVEESNKLAAYYRPIEHDLLIPIEERAKIIIQWWEKHYEILSKYGMNKFILEDVVNKNKVCLREGFVDFFKILNKFNTPILIFSAGIGDVINLYLEKYELKKDTVHIISNLCEWDKKGNFVNIKGEIIHSLNKEMVEVKNQSYFKQVQNKKNIILFGDSISDINMSSGFNYENIIKIGFFNKKVSDMNYELVKEKYVNVYDLVLEGDGSLEPIIKILNEILLYF